MFNGGVSADEAKQHMVCQENHFILNLGTEPRLS